MPAPPPDPSLPLQVVLDSSLESRWVGANDLADLLAALEEEESRHSPDRELLSNGWDLVDVELVEACVCVVVGEPVTLLVSILTCAERGRWMMYSLAHSRRNDLTRPTPGRKAVNHHQGILVSHSLIKVVLGLQVVHALAHIRCRNGERSKVFENRLERGALAGRCSSEGASAGK